MSGPQTSTPLSIWAVSDGRTGIENQVLGLAEAVARQLRGAEISLKRIAWRRPFNRLPSGFVFAPSLMLSPYVDPIGPPWPDLWIAAGRASLPLSIRMSKWSKGRTFVVQLQDPRWPAKLFDLVIPPLHDELEGDNVLPILGAPNRVTPKRLAEGLTRFAARLQALPPGRKIALMVGGASRGYSLTAAHAAFLGDQILNALDHERATLLLSFSRRTPRAAQDILTRKLAGRGWIWDGGGENPYFAFLAAADLILVTEDSVNMATEAATAGKPVLTLPLEGESIRIRRFHAALQTMGASRVFDGALTPWPVTPLAETDRAAEEVLRRMREIG
jgi:mitochondrial fission protein ELM1